MRQPAILALLPLDERPATGRLAAMIGAVAGARVVLPPVELMPRVRKAGDLTGIEQWLNRTAIGADAAVVSLEMLAFGGLVPSRIGNESVAAALARWETLARIEAPVHASCVIMRTPDADDDTEEPAYYQWHGRAIHAASTALAQGRAVPAGTDLEVLGDFLSRRLRNHVLNLAAIRLAMDGTVTSLVLGADDTAGAALGTREQQWLRQWPQWLGLEHRVLTYAGADEIGSVLLARALVQHQDAGEPTVSIRAIDGLERVAPYENAPVIETIRGQLRAAGCREAASGEHPDLALVIHPPAGVPGDFALVPPIEPDPDRARRTAALVADLLKAGQRVSVADCAYPNGADPALVDALHEALDGQWSTLSGFAAWNTAGNTIGTAVAHGVAVVIGEQSGHFDADAHARLIMHRLLEDWGWMSAARADVREHLGSNPTHHDRVPTDGTAERHAAWALGARLAELDGSWTLTDVTFPWGRTFEIDFTILPS